MRIIAGDRGTGKTVELIRESAKTGAYIVVSSRRQMVYVLKKAMEMQLEIPIPLTYKELLDRQVLRGQREPHVLIDDLDLFLR